MNEEFKKNFEASRKQAREMVYSELAKASKDAVVEKVRVAKDAAVNAYENGIARNASSNFVAATAGVLATVKTSAVAVTVAVLSTPHVAGGAAIMKGLAVTGALLGGGAVAGVSAIGIGAASVGVATYLAVRKITRKK